VTLIRIAAVAAFFCSGGLVFLAYIVASFIMPVDYGLPVSVSTEARATS
jgi:phage shock protein PspC (stress-responsive transcriptional regulator)